MAKHTSSTTDLTLVVSRDPEIHSGDLVLAGTRVPVDNLIVHLKSGRTLEQFIAAFRQSSAGRSKPSRTYLPVLLST
jgi:uncharacterized protein (DUF433 family)